MTIKEAVYNYNGRKRLTDKEIRHIKWFMKTQSLSVEDAVKAYFEDKEQEKKLSYTEYKALHKKIRDEIRSHCQTCKYCKGCIKEILLDGEGIADLKTIQRSECWVN